jgi:hypothetical protein
MWRRYGGRDPAAFAGDPSVWPKPPPLLGEPPRAEHVHDLIICVMIADLLHDIKISINLMSLRCKQDDIK